MLKSVSIRSLAAGACLLSLPAHALADTETKKNWSESTLEEIIVTAQKRSEDLQSVPESVQVISGVQLQELNTNSLTDLSRTLPSVNFTTSSKSNSLSMRGIGSSPGNVGYDQAVAI